MALLRSMPPLDIGPAELRPFGKKWKENDGALSRTPPFSSLDLGKVFDERVAKALSKMLGDIKVVEQTGSSLIPPDDEDCVEHGKPRVIGGIRPQNFDVCYRPDGVRFAFDSKTLNDTESVGKNYQNMINDLGTEATTVHTRFPYAVVAFLVVIPEPCLQQPQRDALIGTLERLSGRAKASDPPHLAEAVTLLVWDPETGKVVADIPSKGSPCRVERFSSLIEEAYTSRYKGLPPHAE